LRRIAVAVPVSCGIGVRKLSSSSDVHCARFGGAELDG
jgi:hypothetical protein